MRFHELQQLRRMFVCDCIILFVLQRVNRMLHLQCIMVSGIVSHVLSSSKRGNHGLVLEFTGFSFLLFDYQSFGFSQQP